MLRAEARGQGQDYLPSQATDNQAPLPANLIPISAKTASRGDRLEQSGGVKPRRITARERIQRTLARAGNAFKSAAVKGVAVALLVGSLATSAFAQQTEVAKPVPLKPVAVRTVQARGDPIIAGKLETPRSGSDIQAHLQRASLVNPFISSIQIPGDDDPLGPEVRSFVWRLVARSLNKAENGPDWTNLMPTTPVDGDLVWRAKIKDGAGKDIDVLPLIIPQVAKKDGSFDEAKFLKLFSRVNNPAPGPNEKDVFLAANPGFKNGRAAYFPLDQINPEPLQPMMGNGLPSLPQFVVTLPDGSKVVHTIGALCVKGNGPSFQPDGAGWYGGDDYAQARKKTPLNEEVRRPIYSGGTTFGLFDYEKDTKTNEYGWQIRDRGGYSGTSLAQIVLKQMVDYQLDADGKPTGNPTRISVDELKDQGRISKTASPSLIWRGFETEYRLSAYKSPKDGVAVLDQVRALFARDEIFSYIANTPAVNTAWQKAIETANGGDASAMTQVWNQAIAGLNQQIEAGKSVLTQKITVDKEGIARVTTDDWVNEAVHRGARNVFIFNDLNLVHNSIAVGGDNINAAFEVVDNDDLNPSGSQVKGDPKQHRNIEEYTGNIEDAIKALDGRVPELKKFEGKVREMMLQQIDKESAIYGSGQRNG